MSDHMLLAVTLATALGSGLVGGVFFAFSTFVMKALARVPAPQGMAVMQAINVTAINLAFMLALFGTAAGCVALIADSLFGPWRAHSTLVLAGSLIYLVGVVAVTALVNVPKNNQLAALDSVNPASAVHWTSYHLTWTTWNHIRTVTALLASAALSLAVYYLGRVQSPL